MESNVKTGLEDRLRLIEEYVNFARDNRKNVRGNEFGNHQMWPVFEAIHGGLKRFILAYSTSAGKTDIALELLSRVFNKAPEERAVVFAPMQTIHETWTSENISGYIGIPRERIVVLKKPEDASLVSDGTRVLVANYQKFTAENYIKAIENFSRNAGVIISDEFHNMKNASGSRAKFFSQIIGENFKARPDAFVIGLSASPAPNKPSDAGMALYILNPERWSKYGDGRRFDYQKDWESLREAIELGMWKIFSRERVKEFHKLPELDMSRFDEPIKVRMLEESAEDYFDAYTGFYEISLSEGDDGENGGRKIGRALADLEKAAMFALIRSPEFKEELQEYVDAGYALNFFSRLKEDLFDYADKEVAGELVRVARSLNGVNDVEVIYGATQERKRLDIQERFSHGSVDVLINQWNCTSEGFAEFAGNRKVAVIPLRCPFDPGRLDQIVGRSYRKGQEAQVDIVLFSPEYEGLRDRIGEYVHAEVEKRKIPKRDSWRPTLFHEDALNICRSKQRIWESLFVGCRTEIGLETSIDEANYGMFCRERIVNLSSITGFGIGPATVRPTIGKEYAGVDGLGNGKNSVPLSDDYDKPDILIETPGRINRFLADEIEKFKAKRNEQEKSWTIADWGSCSSAVFCQARIYRQAVEEARGQKIGRDAIINVDGYVNIVRRAKEYMTSGEWAKVLAEKHIELFKKADGDEVAEKAFSLLNDPLKYAEILQKISYQEANFARQNPHGDRTCNVIVTSQCLQYNNQTTAHDIENIVINANHALKDSGLYLAVLTCNTKSGRSAGTTEEDFENFKKIVSYYGFNILYSGQPEGRDSDGGVALRPFYYISAEKQNHVSGKYVEEYLPVYNLTKDYVSGGTREECLFKRARGRRKGARPLPVSYNLGKTGRE